MTISTCDSPLRWPNLGPRASGVGMGTATGAELDWTGSATAKPSNQYSIFLPIARSGIRRHGWLAVHCTVVFRTLPYRTVSYSTVQSGYQGSQPSASLQKLPAGQDTIHGPGQVRWSAHPSHPIIPSHSSPLEIFTMPDPVVCGQRGRRAQHATAAATASHCHYQLGLAGSRHKPYLPNCNHSTSQSGRNHNLPSALRCAALRCATMRCDAMRRGTILLCCCPSSA